MVRPRDSRVSLPLSPSLSLSFSLTQRWKKIESSPYPINFDEFRGGKTTGRKKSRTNSIRATNHVRGWRVPARSRGARSVSVARVPLLPANHIRQNAHLYLDPPDRAHSLPCRTIYRRPIVIDAIRAELLEIAPQNSSSYSSDKNFALGKGEFEGRVITSGIASDLVSREKTDE